MFNNLEETVRVVEGTYKKLKLFYFYDKTLLYIKTSIAEFESGSDFEERLRLLAKALFEKDSVYFEALIEKLDYVVLPKSFKSLENDERLIRGNTDKNKKITKVNFYISLPIELLIIDLMWTLFIKKICISNLGEFNYSYAGKFKKSVFNSNDNLIEGIDFDSNRCFEPYFESYIKWRNTALDTIGKDESSEDLTLISLDLKSFYYTVNFDFQELNELFILDERYRQIADITILIEKTYKCYTDKILKYKKGIKVKNHKNIFPIGLISPFVLREICMKKVDDKISDKLAPLYYGRYVDDILIVVHIGDMQKVTVDTLIENMLIDNDIVLPIDREGEYCFFDRRTIKLQREKINCFYFEKGKENILIDVYNQTIRKASSEANLLPDIDLLSQSFNCRAYAMNSSDGSGKIRNLEFMESDNYNATLFVNGLKRIIKNATYDTENINQYLDDITEFYSGSQAIEFSNSWRSVFELLILCKDKKRANEFYKNINNSINDLSFEILDEKELYEAKKGAILKHLKKNLSQKLDESIALAVSLDYERGSKKHIDLARKIRESNMLNHTMVSFPLINYSSDRGLENISLINTNIEEIMRSITDRKKLFKLDDKKLKWSPRFIHLDELYFCTFFYSIGNGNSLIRNDNDEIFSRYKKMNHLSDKIISPIESDKETSLNDVNVVRKDIVVKDYKNIKNTRIGLVSTDLSENEVMTCLINPKEGINNDKKQRLFKILNSAKEENVDYLVFPEFYMPVIWLSDISKFAKQNGITIITGIQYIVTGKRVFNTICIINSICGKNRFRNSIPLFREKNYYAPDERLHLSQLGYVCKDQKIPYYYLINNGVESFSTILCFEFTDIGSRFAMKSNIEMLFVPQLNRDTNYFASIVESASRDLHCFVIQANTSIYGDSRITAPFKTDYKDFVKIKGGVNELLIVGEVNIPELVDFKANYFEKYEKQIAKCSSCSKIKNVNDIKIKCEKCKEKLKKSKIKGLPPNWK